MYSRGSGTVDGPLIRPLMLKIPNQDKGLTAFAVPLLPGPQNCRSPRSTVENPENAADCSQQQQTDAHAGTDGQQAGQGVAGEGAAAD